MSCLPFWSFYCCLIYIFFLLLLYILLDLYSHLCSSIQLKTDWWAQMFGGKHNGEFSGDFASWPWRPGWIFISNVDIVHLDFIFKANIGFLIRWWWLFVTYLAKTLWEGLAGWHKRTKLQMIKYIEPYSPNYFMKRSHIQMPVIMGFGVWFRRTVMFGVYSQCYFLKWIYGIVNLFSRQKQCIKFSTLDSV